VDGPAKVAELNVGAGESGIHQRCAGQSRLSSTSIVIGGEALVKVRSSYVAGLAQARKKKPWPEDHGFLKWIDES